MEKSYESRDPFLCSVCYATTNIMKVTTTCGHHLCFVCTTKLIKRECPICRCSFPETADAQMTKDLCYDCRAPMVDLKKCCEKAKCTLCLMNQINEDSIHLQCIQFNKCANCFTAFPERVLLLLDSKKKSLIQMNQKMNELTRQGDFFSKPTTLTYSSYQSAYGNTILPPNFSFP